MRFGDVVVPVAAALVMAGTAVVGAGPAQAAYDPGLDPGIAVDFPDATTFALSAELRSALGRDTLDLAGARSLLGTRHAQPAAPTPPVGTVRKWPAIDDTTRTGLPLIGIYLKEYRLLAAGPALEVWAASGTDDVSVGTAFPAGDCRAKRKDPTVVTPAQAQRLVGEFTERMLPAESKAFSVAPEADGTLSPGHLEALGVDFRGDGGAAVTLVDNVRDANFYDFENNRTYIAGFFAQIFNTLTNRNVMTIDAFDWEHRTGANPPDEPAKDICQSRPSRPLMYEATFAHEYQHLLQSYADPRETTWLNEGLSDMAESVVGYAHTRATIDDQKAESHLYCFQGWGLTRGRGNQNPIRCGGPQNSLTLWNDEGSGSEVLADYGNAWSFLLYLNDRFGPKVISELHNDGERQGLESVAAVLAKVAPGTDVMDVLHDYQLMNLLDNLASAPGARVVGVERAVVTSRSLSAGINVRIPASHDLPGATPNGVDYVLLRADRKVLPGRALRSLTFTGATTLPSQVSAADPLAALADLSGPPGVENWTVRLVGLDRKGNRALVRTYPKAFDLQLDREALAAFASYPNVVAMISHDDSREALPAAARYELQVNGRIQPGGV